VRESSKEIQHCLTFHIWDPEVEDYTEEKLETYEHGMPPTPIAGEEVLINVSGSGEVPEYRSYTVVRRVFEYTTGWVLLMNIPGKVYIESVGVSLYVRPSTESIPGNVTSVS
jgi:hypothetical protein